MNKVKIITDTACDLTMDFLAAEGIGVVPMTINFLDRSYRDGFDLGREEFYRLLTSTEKLPTTAQPTPGDFLQVMQAAVAAGQEAVVITISSGMSGTYESALLAREQLDQKEKIGVFDSRTASLGQGLLVLKAQEMAAAGKGKRNYQGINGDPFPLVLRLYPGHTGIPSEGRPGQPDPGGDG